MSYAAILRSAGVLAAAALSAAPVFAGEEPTLDKADTAWMMVSTILVLFMTIPGIALFYAGMARKKNLLSLLAQTTVICCALTLVWVTIGYSLAFTPGNPFIGNFSQAMLMNIGIKDLSGSIPTLLFVIFQMTFCVLTAALMIGSFAGRMKFSSMLVFMLACTLVRTYLAPEESHSLMSSFREGLLVIGWVALWKPVEELLFNWWPLDRERKDWRRLGAVDMRIEVY